MTAERKARSSGGLPPPSPPAEKASARQDQTRQAGTDDGAGTETSATLINIVNVDLGQPLAVPLFFEDTDGTPPTFVTSPLSLT
jgi:hypothetical protein